MKYYTVDEIEKMYSQEYPQLSTQVIQEKARRLHSQLNTMDIGWRRSNRRFYYKNELNSF